MNKRLFVLMAFLCILFLAAGVAYAGPNDGSHDFSVGPDVALGGVRGDIYESPEDGTNAFDFNIPMPNPSAEVDALSGHHRYSPWNHDVSLEHMIRGEYYMMYSVDNDSDIHEWFVNGLEPVPNGPGRTATYAHRHDSAVDLDLASQDLDALESHDHPGYRIPFPGVPSDWKNGLGVYYSVERSGFNAVPLGFIPDDGDVYEHLIGLYLDDSIFGPVVGFNPDEEQLDALIVYDVAGELNEFDGGTGKLDSDAIFFSLAPGVKDPIGDDVFWYSAAFGGIGGLYFDPHLFENVDALDNHPIPEPGTMILLGSGLLGLAGFSRKKFKKS